MPGRITGAQHGTYAALIDQFRTALSDAAAHRDERREWDHDTGEPAWVAYEREQMLALVNALRAEGGLPPMDPDVVLRVERSACGHVDYAAKYAIGCAELVWFGSRGRPGT